MNIMDFFNDDANSVWEAMSCQRLVNAHVFNKEIHSGMRFPAPSKKENIGSRIRVGQTYFDEIKSPFTSCKKLVKSNTSIPRNGKIYFWNSVKLIHISFGYVLYQNVSTRTKTHIDWINR